MGRQHTRRRQRGGKSMYSIMEEIEDKIRTIQVSPLKNKDRYLDVLSSSKDLLQEIETSFPSTKVAKAQAELSFLHRFHKNHEPLYNLLIRPVDNLTSVVDALPVEEPNVLVEEPISIKKGKKEKTMYTIEIDGKSYTTTNRDLYFLLRGQGKEATIQKNKKSRKTRKHRK